ncbi:uncharacterized protein ACMZJ9_020602 [Mantella aurantiaca]
MAPGSDGSSNRNPPERCPRPLYSRDSTQEDLTIPHHHQGEDVMEIKVEGEVEETYVRDDQQYTEEEAGMMRTSLEEDTPTEISTGHAMEKPSKDHLTLSPGCKMEDDDITGEKTMISSMDGGDHSVDRSCDPSDQPCTVRDGAATREEKTFSCPECEESFTSELSLNEHQTSHLNLKFHSCPECGKCFPWRSKLLRHQRFHTGEKPYSCPECRKCFTLKGNLVRHQRSHTGEKPYSCPECGKCFSQKTYLLIHQRSHTGEKPYSCPECNKCFSSTTNLKTHQRSHTGEKPYCCSECGKCFTLNFQLKNHQKYHMEENPYSCSECGKRYAWKSNLVNHQRSHTGEKP